jgi:Flp pilus assembly protein TadG
MSGRWVANNKKGFYVMRSKYSSQKGASAVEFALLLPLLMVITFGIIEFGVFLYNQQVITNASREGARAGIVAGSPRVPPTGANSIDSVVQNYCGSHILFTFGTYSAPTTIVTGYSSSATFGTNLTVQVNYNYSFLVIPNFIPGIAKLRAMQAITVMKYE